MASRLHVNNIIKESGSGDVAFPTGGAIFNGNLTVQNATFDNISSVLSLGQYTNATRPASPTQGTIIYNVSVGQVQIWNGDRWVLLDTKGGTLPEVGQVVHLDATKTSSYSGSGTTWTDLSGQGNNFNINASFARKISHNSGRDSSGNDVDGLNWQDRGLVSINGRF